MKSKKSIIIAVACSVAFFALLAGVVIWRVTSMLSDHRDSVLEDTNGEANFSLQTITREDIASDTFEYFSLFYSGGNEGARSDISDHRLKENDYDVIHETVGELHGVRVLQATKTQNESMTLTVTSDVTKGNAAIAVVIDGAFYCEVPINQTEQIELSGIAGKTVLVKLAGESAEFEVTVERKYS